MLPRQALSAQLHRTMARRTRMQVHGRQRKTYRRRSLPCSKAIRSRGQMFRRSSLRSHYRPNLRHSNLSVQSTPDTLSVRMADAASGAQRTAHATAGAQAERLAHRERVVRFRRTCQSSARSYVHAAASLSRGRCRRLDEPTFRVACLVRGMIHEPCGHRGTRGLRSVQRLGGRQNTWYLVQVSRYSRE